MVMRGTNHNAHTIWSLSNASTEQVFLWANILGACFRPVTMDEPLIPFSFNSQGTFMGQIL